MALCLFETKSTEDVFGAARRCARTAVRRWNAKQDADAPNNQKTPGKPSEFQDLTIHDVRLIESWAGGNRKNIREFNQWLQMRYPEVIAKRLGLMKDTHAAAVATATATTTTDSPSNNEAAHALLGLMLSTTQREQQHNVDVEPIDDPYPDEDDSTTRSTTEQPPLKRRRLNDTKEQSEPPDDRKGQPDSDQQHLKVIVEDFPRFELLTRFYNDDGQLRASLERLRLVFQEAKSQPHVTVKRAIRLGDLWVPATDFVRFVGPRGGKLSQDKFRDRLAAIENYARKRCGVYCTTNKMWMLSLSRLISMYKFRDSHHETTYARLVQIRDAIQTCVDQRDILISLCDFSSPVAAV